MKVMIEGSTKEIVDLVVEVQDRLSEENYKNFFAPITIDDGDITIGGEEISKIISEVTSDDTQNKNMNRNEIIKELEKQLQLLSERSTGILPEDNLAEMKIYVLLELSVAFAALFLASKFASRLASCRAF